MAARSLRSTPNACCSNGSTAPSPNAGSSRPPDSVARVANSLASTIGLRPGSTITDIPNLRFVVRPAPNAIATSGSGASALIRSDSHSESKSSRSSSSTTTANVSPLRVVRVPRPNPMRTFIRFSVRRRWFLVVPGR